MLQSYNIGNYLKLHTVIILIFHQGKLLQLFTFKMPLLWSLVLIACTASGKVFKTSKKDFLIFWVNKKEVSFLYITLV